MNIAFSDHLRHHQDVRANSNSGITCFSEKSRSTSGSRATAPLHLAAAHRSPGILGDHRGYRRGSKRGIPGDLAGTATLSPLD